MLDLEAIERIKQLKARYFRGLDVCDIELLKTVFTSDARVEFHSPTYDFYLNGWDELEAFFRKRFTSQLFGLHNGHTPEIEVDGDQAKGLWYLHDIFLNLQESTLLTGSAIYEDEYVRQGGDWRIASMYYTRRLEMIEPLRDEVKITSRPISD